jgi:hypothetical protein
VKRRHVRADTCFLQANSVGGQAIDQEADTGSRCLCHKHQWPSQQSLLSQLKTATAGQVLRAAQLRKGSAVQRWPYSDRRCEAMARTAECRQGVLTMFIVLASLMGTLLAAGVGPDPADGNINIATGASGSTAKAPPPTPARSSTLPHVFFLLADDLGTSDIGYNDPSVVSPTLDALAKEGIILTDHCEQPARRNLLDSHDPHRPLCVARSHKYLSRDQLVGQP